MNFLNKTVVVTGGTRGIGAAIGHSFAELGARVILTGKSPSTEQLALKGSIEYQVLDLDDVNSLEAFLEFLNALGQIDVLVNNAGINIINPLEQVVDEDFERILNVNLRGPFKLCRAMASLMKVRGGRIVNLASIWSVITRPGRSAYIVSKAAIDGLTRGAATDLAPNNILVNTVSPGFVLTQLTRDSLSDVEIDALKCTIPLGRLATPEEIARLVRFLCSDENTYITGQNIVIDGGYTHV
ncbi:MAG: SDR family oxidoreductase [Hahellaceae bacterium]|nr:SDR family oxidoreductase [Hahellaceae bacterium]